MTCVSFREGVSLMTAPPDLFSRHKPIIAMLHAAGLPGSSRAQHSLAEVIERAVHEACILAGAGFDALLLQNTGDIPAPDEGDEATVAYLTRIAQAVREETDLPLGINVLMNGSRAALAVASAAGGAFVRIKVAVGAVISSTGLVTADPYAVLAFRRRIGAEHIAILADVYDRTATPVGDMPLEVMADLAIRHGGADGLVITGYSPADTLERLRRLRSALPGARLLAGGGATPENIDAMLEASDGVIVGSAYKTGGGFLDPVDPAKASAFMQSANRARQSGRSNRAGRS
jgi:hypothetical protein